MDGMWPVILLQQSSCGAQNSCSQLKCLLYRPFNLWVTYPLHFCYVRTKSLLFSINVSQMDLTRGYWMQICSMWCKDTYLHTYVRACIHPWCCGDNIVQGSPRLVFLPFLLCGLHSPPLHGYLYSDMYACDYIPQPCCLFGLWLELLIMHIVYTDASKHDCTPKDHCENG